MGNNQDLSHSTGTLRGGPPAHPFTPSLPGVYGASEMSGNVLAGHTTLSVTPASRPPVSLPVEPLLPMPPRVVAVVLSYPASLPRPLRLTPSCCALGPGSSTPTCHAAVESARLSFNYTFEFSET